MLQRRVLMGGRGRLCQTGSDDGMRYIGQTLKMGRAALRWAGPEDGQLHCAGQALLKVWGVVMGGCVALSGH